MTNICHKTHRSSSGVCVCVFVCVRVCVCECVLYAFGSISRHYMLLCFNLCMCMLFNTHTHTHTQFIIDAPQHTDLHVAVQASTPRAIRKLDTHRTCSPPPLRALPTLHYQKPPFPSSLCHSADAFEGFRSRAPSRVHPPFD
jgi:hypothetical protein